MSEFSISGEAYGFGGGVTFDSGMSTAKMKRSSRLQRDSAHKDRENAYKQSLIWGPQITASKYKAMRKAGLHPAFGTGNQQGMPVLAGGVTGVAGGGGPRGPSSAASFKVVNKYEALINEANLGLITARTDFVREQTEASISARNSPGTVPAAGEINVIPDTQVTTRKDDKSTAAATNPAWNTQTVAPGVTFDFLGSEISENFENPIMALAFIERNKTKIAHYGLKYLYDKNPMTYAKNVMQWIYSMSKKPGNKLAQSRKYDSRVDSRSPARRLKP